MLPRKVAPGLWTSLDRSRGQRSPSFASRCLRSFCAAPLPRVARAFELKTYGDDEIGAAFDKVDANSNGFLDSSEVQHLPDVQFEELKRIVSSEKDMVDGIPRDAFVKAVADLAERLDNRIYPIAGSLILTGFSVGIFGPATPLLITELGMSTAQTGLLTTGFGVAKLLANIPCGVASDKYGRQPVIVMGCGCLTLGTLFVGLASSMQSYEVVLLGRVLNGAGVSALITGAFVAAADVSTPRNRARSMAPLSIGFNFGNAFGPFAAGVLISGVGLTHTFIGSGALLGLNTLTSLALIRETRPPIAKTEEGFSEAFAGAVRSWVPLLQSSPLRQATLYQSLFWGAFGAGFMTSLPILLGETKLGLSASALGLCYGGIAVTNVIAAQPLATFTDKVGKEQAMVGGLGLLGVSLVGLPLCNDLPALSLALGGWAISSTLLFPVPQAVAADNTSPQDRSNALSMVRTLGDVGLVVGGLGASVLGTSCSIETILAVSGWTCIGTSLGTVGRRFLNAAEA